MPCACTISTSSCHPTSHCSTVYYIVRLTNECGWRSSDCGIISRRHGCDRNQGNENYATSSTRGDTSVPGNKTSSSRHDAHAAPEAGLDALDPSAVANRLRPVLLRIHRYLRSEAHELGVTSTQASLLGAISRAPGIGLGELAAQEHMSAPTLVSHVDKLRRRVSSPVSAAIPPIAAVLV